MSQHPLVAGREVSAAGPRTAELLLEDTFDVDLPLGALVGSRNRSGARRGGVDAERALGIDHGAARIRCLVDPGWQRAALVYGPFPSRPGLTLAVSLVNGLNTSQTSDLPEGRRAKVRRLVRNLPRLVWNEPVLRDNLAVGWFREALPAHPPSAGDCLVNGPGPGPDGELRAHLGDRPGASRIAYGVQNLPVTLVAARRADSTVLFASSLPGAHGYGGYPSMRPVALAERSGGASERHGAAGDGEDAAAGTPDELYAGIHQSILGEVHYRTDTRIHAVRAALLPEAASWRAWALAADRFTGVGPLGGSASEGPARATGPAPEHPRWATTGASVERTPSGGVCHGDATASLELAEPAGLVHLVVDAGPGSAGRIAVAFRGAAAGERWQLTLGGDGARLEVHHGDTGRPVAAPPDTIDLDAPDTTPADCLATDASATLSSGRHELQILDDGATVGAYLDGELLFGRWFADDRLAGRAAVGVAVAGAPDLRLRRFEALPRLVPIPPLLDPGPPWQEHGRELVLVDRFAGGETGDLAGRRPEVGGGTWQRDLGEGVFEWRAPGVAAVRAEPGRPNPGRTVYTLAWPDPDFVDVAVTVTPPGTTRGDGNAGRGGLVLWQDEGNHLVFNNFIDDGPEGISISVFLRTGGHEEMFDWDAVWSNVNGRIRRGVPYRLRVCCDGARFVCYLDGEPVVHRSISDYRASAAPLAIRRVGLVANWEWGDDTGTRFADFEARGRAAASPTSSRPPAHGSPG